MYKIHVGSSNWKLKHGYSYKVEACNFGKFPCIMLYGFCVERENVDIDLVHFSLFFSVKKGLYTYKDTFALFES